MNKEEIKAHHAHYNNNKMGGYREALFQALDVIGVVVLDSEINDFTASLLQSGFVISPLAKSDGQPITSDLLEEYGFDEDEPGAWFLINEDDPTDLSVQVTQSLRRQDKWQLFINGGEDEEDVQVALIDFPHLLKVLEENGITFEEHEEGGEE